MTPQRQAIVAEIMRTKGHISPTALARMKPRSHSMAWVKMAIPAPSRPSRLATGTGQSSMKSWPMGDVRTPIFCTAGLMVRPGMSFSTRKALTPPAPLSGSTVAKTSIKSATGPLVTKLLLPFSR